MLRISKGTKSKYIVNIQSFAEAVEQVLLLSFSPIFTVKRFTKRDEKCTRRFLIIIGVVTVVLLGFAILCISTVFDPV